MPERIAGYDKEYGRSKKMRDKVGFVQEMTAWSKSYRSQAREQAWKKSERAYNGKQHEPSDTDYDLVTINMLFSTINTIVPYVTGSTPFFRVTPYSGTANGRDAAAWTAWMNLTWNSYEVKGDVSAEDATFDALLYGDGYLQVSWDYFDELIETDDIFADDRAASVAKLFIDRVDPWDVWLDPASDGMHNARWVIVRRTLPLSQVKSNPKYRYTGDLMPRSDWDERRDFVDSDGQSDTEGGSEHGLIDLYEFYDLVEQTLYVVTEDGEMPHRVVEGARPPIAQLSNYKIPNSPYHMGEMEQLHDLQDELNKTRSQMITHRRRNVPKYLAAEDKLGSGAVAALKSEEPGEVVLVKGDIDPRSVISPLDLTQLTADSYQVSDLIVRDIYEISGVNEYLRGGTPQISRTATEASIIESASNIKSSYKLKMVERFLRDIGQIMLDVAFDVFPETDFSEQQFVITGGAAQQLANKEPELEGRQVNEVEMNLDGEMFSGVYQVQVDPRSTELRSPTVKAQRYQEMFMTFLQAAPQMQQLGMPIPNLRKIAELWLEAFGVTDPNLILDGDEGANMQQQMMAMAAQGGGQPGGGIEPQAGVPSMAEPPIQAPTPDNSGMLPPG